MQILGGYETNNRSGYPVSRSLSPVFLGRYISSCRCWMFVLYKLRTFHCKCNNWRHFNHLPAFWQRCDVAFLFWLLSIDWEVGYLWIYCDNCFDMTSWSLLLANTFLAQGHGIFCTKMKNNKATWRLGKKFSHWPAVLVPPCHPGVGHVVLLVLLLHLTNRSKPSSTASLPLAEISPTLDHLGCCSYMIFAWCHSFSEFKSLWVEMCVPSSTSIVKGFLYAIIICISR